MLGLTAGDEVNGSDCVVRARVSVCAGFLLRVLWVTGGVVEGAC
jgi:hypothetical protein